MKRKLSNVPSKIWALFYLILIPIYAVLYSCWLGSHFYHSTIQYEDALLKDKAVLLHELQNSIIDDFRHANSSDIIESNGWELDVGRLVVYDILPLSDVIGIKIQLPLVKKTPRKNLVITLSFEVTYPVGDETIEFEAGGDRRYLKSIAFNPNELTLSRENFTRYGIDEQYTLDYSRLFPWRDEPLFTGRFLTLSPSVNERLEGFWRGMHGFPSLSSGAFWRMLYLSAITITTVGYGDIVPLTTTARMTVASEAILGIVIIGLFISSLLRERA